MLIALLQGRGTGTLPLTGVRRERKGKRPLAAELGVRHRDLGTGWILAVSVRITADQPE